MQRILLWTESYLMLRIFGWNNFQVTHNLICFHCWGCSSWQGDQVQEATQPCPIEFLLLMFCCKNYSWVAVIYRLLLEHCWEVSIHSPLASSKYVCLILSIGKSKWSRHNLLYSELLPQGGCSKTFNVKLWHVLICLWTPGNCQMGHLGMTDI